MNVYIIHFTDNSEVKVTADWYDYRYHLVAFYMDHKNIVSYNALRIHSIELGKT